jgi:NADH:ubiquinone oxidoreductase subunit K
MDTLDSSVRTPFWPRIVTTLACVTVVLVAVNIYFVYTNQSLQREVNERQQFIAQSVQIQVVAREMITALANLAMKNNDQQIRQMLTAHGITFTADPPQATPESPGQKK